MHLLHHVADGVRNFGPVYGSWMFSYERFNSWLHRRVMNRRFPEATLMETYRVCWILCLSVAVVLKSTPTFNKLAIKFLSFKSYFDNRKT